MSEKDFETICIIGVGLLGGSLGLAIKRRQPAVRVVGVGHRAVSGQQALEAGAVDEFTLDAARGVRQADLVVLCTPVGLFEPLLQQAGPALKPGALVTDVGSTKGDVVRLGERHVPPPAQFVGSHPMAGSEKRGVTFARADLYAGHMCIVTPTERTDPEAAERIEAFWRALQMRTVRLDPQAHDEALAGVSHLPHALAACLVSCQTPERMDLAGPGFLDVTRIAGGDAALWRDIFASNRRSVLAAIDAFEQELQAFREALQAGQDEEVQAFLARAQAGRAAMLERRRRGSRPRP